jgi:predicted RNA-binding Zn-ribbon protein involved in translation (DUF1610 family)
MEEYNVKGNSYSEYALKLVREQHKTFNCPKCDHELLGERYCPNCGAKIVYAGEADYYLKNNSLYKFGNGVQKAGNTIGKVGDSMASCGTTFTLLITVPIIIILILLFL